MISVTFYQCKVQRTLEALKSKFFVSLAFCLACESGLLSRLCFNRREKSFFLGGFKKKKKQKRNLLSKLLFFVVSLFFGLPNVPL